MKFKYLLLVLLGAVAYQFKSPHPSLSGKADLVELGAQNISQTDTHAPSYPSSRSTQGTADPYADLVGIEANYRVPEAGLGAPSQACPQHEGLLDGREPQTTPKIASRSDYTVLCNTQYVNASLGATKTGFWSAWRLSREGIERSRGIRREDSFRPDDRLPTSYQPSLEDYRGSGLDRGHIFPNGDGYSAESRAESFVLSNVFPQSAAHNQGMWNDLEQRTRKLALRHGEVYVVTGVAFIGDHIAQIGHTGLYVPPYVYKAVYIPAQHKASACLSVNAAAGRCRWVSIEELTQFTGTNPFPALDGTEAAASVFPW